MRLKNLLLSNSLYFFFSLLWLHGCGLFSFLGTSLTPDVKTFSIQQFYTEVSEGPPDMAQKLTETLEAKILHRTALIREEKDGDIQYEGVIKSFKYTTTSLSAKNETTNTPKEVQRLTITIEVSYVNPFDEETSFKKKRFSASADMTSTENQTEKEPDLIEEIFRQLVEAICEASINNW